MRVMVIVKASTDSEAGAPPDPEMLARMGRFNEELVNAGVMLAADGLKASSNGARITFKPGGVVVTDGPFAETKELVAGFWIWKVRSMDEAIAWAKRCPNPMPGHEGQLELRPIFEVEDFGENLTAEVRAQAERLRKAMS